jgi:hypothetical protein
MFFEHTVERCGNALCIVAQVTQVITDKTQLRLLRGHIFDHTYFIDSLLMKYVTAQTINSVRRVNDNTTTKQTLCNSSYVAVIGIFSIYM